MKRLAITAVACVAAILLASVVSASGSSSSRGGKTISVVQKRTSIQPVGNTITLTNDYFSHGRKIGRDQIACIAIGPGAPGFLECSASHFFAGGQLESQGAVNPANSKFTTAITGGTGRFRNARGTVDSTHTNATQNTLVFHIIG
jgi:hypothetical protein